MKRADGDEEREHSVWKIGKLPHADEWPEDGRAEFTPLFAFHTQHYQTGDLWPCQSSSGAELKVQGGEKSSTAIKQASWKRKWDQ